MTWANTKAIDALEYDIWKTTPPEPSEMQKLIDQLQDDPELMERLIADLHFDGYLGELLAKAAEHGNDPAAWVQIGEAICEHVAVWMGVRLITREHRPDLLD